MISYIYLYLFIFIYIFKDKGDLAMDKKCILIVEDDKDISMIEEAYLKAAGFETLVCKNGNKVLPLLHTQSFDLILLDLMLPGKSGEDICREIRDLIDIPILMVTARSDSLDKIAGLSIGADDYISKPFDPAELVARISSHLRQYERLKHPAISQALPAAPEIIVGSLRILPDSWQVYKGDTEIRFPNREFELLRFLASNPDIVFSKETLFEKIWGYDSLGDSSTVMVHINRIREKIEDDKKNPKILETVWGAGYRLNKKSLQT